MQQTVHNYGGCGSSNGAANGGAGGCNITRKGGNAETENQGSRCTDRFHLFHVFSYSVFSGYSIDKAVEHEGGRPTAGL